MWKKTVVALGVTSLLLGAMQSRVAIAGDDIWDLMNPAWWFDDDDDDWRYGYYGPGPHAYGPYGWGAPPPYYGYAYNQPAKKQQPPAPHIPE